MIHLEFLRHSPVRFWVQLYPAEICHKQNPWLIWSRFRPVQLPEWAIFRFWNHVSQLRSDFSMKLTDKLTHFDLSTTFWKKWKKSQNNRARKVFHFGSNLQKWWTNLIAQGCELAPIFGLKWKIFWNSVTFYNVVSIICHPPLR